MTPFPVLISASPDFADESILEETCARMEAKYPEIEFHIPAVKGSIKTFIDYARRKGHKIKVHQPDYAGWGAAALAKCYYNIAPIVKGFIFFWNGETTNWGERLVKQLPTRVVEYKSLKKQLTEAKAELKKKPKAKPAAVRTPKSVILRYLQQHEVWFKSNTPQAYKDGFYAPPKFPDVRTANGLTNAILNYITWSGFRATRINTQGQFVTEKYKGKIASTGFRKSMTRRGTADISATVNGKSVMIEIKTGSDKPSPDQLKEQQRERAAGGVYEFVHSMDEFFTLYDTLLK